MGGGKGGGSVTVGYRYYMTLQMILGRGPLDEIVEIRVGDKTAWPRPATAAETVATQLINGEFDNGLTGWTTSGNVTASGGKALIIGAISAIEQAVTIVADDIGKTHTLRVKASTGYVRLTVGTTAGGAQIATKAFSGEQKVSFKPNVGTIYIRIQPLLSIQATIDFCEVNNSHGETVTGEIVTAINAPNLFGGDKAEGGVSGSLTVMMGGPSQVYPAWVKTLLGGLVPDFRGVATAIFDGLICSLNPYPKTWKWRVRRSLEGWDGPVWRPELATINLVSDSTVPEGSDKNIKAMNPAHIIYECVTNRSWGRGYNRNRINDVSWTAAAQTLYDESFGLCIAWKREGTLEEFVGDVIRHIGATMYVSRETGLLELKLIRGDYDIEDLPLFDYNSGLIEVEDPETATLADAIGEVIITYHNPVTDEDLQRRAHNLAILQTAEGINSQKVSYSGLPTAALADRVANRDLKAQSSEASRYKCKFDRRAWKLYPGAVFRISAPDKGISNLVLRAGKLEETDLVTGHISCEALIDVFGLPSQSFGEIENGGYVPPSKTPEVVSDRYIREATYVEVYLRSSEADRAYIEPTDTAIATLAGRSNPLMLSYEIVTKTADEAYVSRNTENFAPTALVDATVGPYNTSITFKNGFDLGLVSDGTLIQIGEEIMVASDVVSDPAGSTGTIEVIRGIHDTVPTSHASNSKIFFLDDNVGSDLREYVMGETVDVKLLSVTSDAVLDQAAAPTDSITFVGRQGRPYPPGNVQVTSGATTVGCYNSPAVGANFSISWAHRDRITQEDRPVGHGEPSVGPEAGTTYNLRFYNTADTLLDSRTGIVGDNISFTASDTLIFGNMIVELEAQRAGYVSFQKYRFPMSRTL